MNFNDYYEHYFGITDNKLTTISKYRELPLNEKYFYPVIVSDYKNLRCSSSEEYYEICNKNFDGTLDSMEKILLEMNKEKKQYKIRKMRRYIVTEKKEILIDSEIVTKELLLSLEIIKNNLEEVLILKKNRIEDKRWFMLFENNNMASRGYISEIYSNGCNIVVFTNNEFRAKGYGKEVVKKCINWSLNKKLIPIYLVEESNIASIKLIESLGGILMTNEWIISK